MTAEWPSRVLFVSHTSEWIGPNISLLELVTRLPDELSACVAVPRAGRFTEALEEEGVPFQLFRRLDKFGIPALAGAIRRDGVSLVYGNSAHGVSRNALIAAKFCGVPFVYHLREMAGRGLRHHLRLFPWADAAVAVSGATADSYRGSFRQTTRVIYNGVSLDRFGLERDRCRARVRREFGIPTSASIVLHVGNVYARKGQLMAVEVAKKVASAVPESYLLLAGRLDRDPAYVEEVRNAVASSGLGDRVMLAGLRSDVDVLMAGSDAFLHTATADPHPRAVIEAMASRLPVVALAVDGVQETVVDGDTGYLVARPCELEDLARPLVRLLGDPELSRAMGDRGRQRVQERFSADATARGVSDVILELLGGR